MTSAHSAAHALHPGPRETTPPTGPTRLNTLADVNMPGLVHLTDLRRQTFTTVDVDTGEVLAEGPLADLASHLPHWPELQAI
jgi:hypothetical protein